jgi:hypothetical protein
MKKNSATRRVQRTDAWDLQWQQLWSKVGLPGYELPVGGPGGGERDFLAQARTPARENQRLKRNNDEFARAFKALYPVGPAVTVFGSARFKQDHRYYRLARAVGVELAKAGVAILTGGGPGIMEAANRGAHAGQTDLLTWSSALAPAKPRVVLTQGEDDPRETLAKMIQQRFRLTSKLPRMGEVIEL